MQYSGHCIDAQGVHTTLDKIEAIQEAPTPQNVKQLRSFLGLVQYYSKFITNRSSLLHPMYQLLKLMPNGNGTTNEIKLLKRSDKS